MDQFIVSARKYRPATFDSVVAQKHVAETLKNAIKSNHLAQAFLFSGPRGVGKTTCARILAKTINCQNRTDKVEPCENCESCNSFNEGHSLNIYELDAASNNSVEDIRKLIDQVRFAPQIGTKKVYIIDEVHMLSQSAFNAFLKTLEEPPAHAIFILATTEKHKILPTILSRCQVFEFNRIEIPDIIRHLQDIAVKESIETEEDALNVLARKSDGSLRDALSMFDQMVSYSGNKLTYEGVTENLGILGLDHYFKLTDHLVQGDVSASLLLFNEVLMKGFDGHHFLLDFAEHLRNLLVAQDHSTIDLLTVGEQIKESYREQTLRVSGEFLVKSLNLISRTDTIYKTSQNQRLLVELTLINIASLSNKPSSTPSQEPVKKKVASEVEEVQNVKEVEGLKEEVEVEKVNEVEKVKEVEGLKEEPQAAEHVAEKPKVDSAAKVEEVEELKEVEEVKEVEVTLDEPEASQTITPTDLKDEVKEVDRSEAIDEVVEKKTSPTKRKFNLNTDVLSDSISISDYTKKHDDKGDNPGSAETQLLARAETVSTEALKSKWDELVHSYEEKGKLSLVSTLTKYEPVFNENLTVEVTCDNRAQIQSLKNMRLDLLEHLRDELKNDSIQIDLKLSDGTYKKPYTPAEKLEKLIEKNPNINLLKDQLDLDIGH